MLNQATVINFLKHYKTESIEFKTSPKVESTLLIRLTLDFFFLDAGPSKSGEGKLRV